MTFLPHKGQAHRALGRHSVRGVPTMSQELWKRLCGAHLSRAMSDGEPAATWGCWVVSPGWRVRSHEGERTVGRIPTGLSSSQGNCFRWSGYGTGNGVLREPRCPESGHCLGILTLGKDLIFFVQGTFSLIFCSRQEHIL